MSARESAVSSKAALPARAAILIVEDEVILAMDLQRTLIELGYDAYAIACSAEAAVKRAQERCPDLVMMDIRIKGRLDGIQAASVLKKQFSTAIIYLTAHADAAMVDRAKVTEPHGYLLKPVGAADLRTTLEIALYKHQLEQARKHYEESLRRATREAQRANGAKSLFIANMSHEIRTPMNAVIGLTYLLGQTALSSEQTGFVAQINIASKSLLAVITDVLDLSKIEAGELMISRVAFCPRELLKALHAIMRVQADFKGITLQLEVDDVLPTALVGDAARLNQILTNLLSNAIKFTERGGVTLCVRLLAVSSSGSTLSFTVRDTGIGIDPVAQARLFTPFIQADESITRRYGGTGLGLSIINSLAKLMGGTVDFTSTLGVGSEFRVVLDFAPASAESLAGIQPVPISAGARPLLGVRVLVVDDYDLNLVVTKRILEQVGALVSVANNGQDALNQLGFQPGRFDVVLMDVQMPIMDGYEATRRIRAELGLIDLPIIAVTAGALLSERQRATAVGLNDFIVKPFDAATLISCVRNHARRMRVPAGSIPSAAQTTPGWPGWPQIAGIDIENARNRLGDDPTFFRELLQRFLGDFSDISGSSSQGVPPDLGERASRLHKMKGAAGILGAKTIQCLADEVELACVGGDANRADDRLATLVSHLNALHSSAARAFEGAPIDSRSAPQTFAARDGTDTPSSESRRPDAEWRCRVLLVDDDDIVRAHLARLLELSGYRVGEVASGGEAVQAVRGGDYQIVISDWNMSGMSGLELCRELRVDGENHDLYVLMLTMGDRSQDVDLCRAAGADAYVLKSAPNEDILAHLAVARHGVQLRTSQGGTERSSRDGLLWKKIS